MTGFVALGPKTRGYLMDDGSEHKIAGRTKKSVIKRVIMYKNYIDYLLNDKTISKSQQRFRSDCHNVYTEETNKIALKSNDDQRLQIFNKITICPYGTNAFKVSEI